MYAQCSRASNALILYLILAYLYCRPYCLTLLYATLCSNCLNTVRTKIFTQMGSVCKKNCVQKILGKYLTVGRGCFYSTNGVCVDKKFATRNLYPGYFFGWQVDFDHYHFAKCLILFVKSTPHPSQKIIYFFYFSFQKKKE